MEKLEDEFSVVWMVDVKLLGLELHCTLQMSGHHSLTATSNTPRDLWGPFGTA